MPEFTPVRAGRSRYRLPRAARGGRRFAAAGLVAAAAALTVAGASGERGPSPDGEEQNESSASSTPPARKPGEEPEKQPVVSLPVRIADSEAAQLVHQGDRVDVIADTPGNGGARVVAQRARVALAPKSGDTVTSDGALVVLTVPRETATALVAASASSLAVALC